MSVDITMTAGNSGGMYKSGGGDIPSLINALTNMSEDQKYRCDLIIDVDGGEKTFHRNANVYSTAISPTSNGMAQYFFDPETPKCYKREVVSGTATDTTYNTINAWSILYADDSLGGNTYPANRVSYDNTESGLEADDVQEAIDELAAGGAGTTVIDWADWIELTPTEQETGDYTIVNCPWADGDISVDLMTKLWENPNPTSSFAAQSLPLDLSGYDLILVITSSVSVTTTNIIGKSVYLTEAVAASGIEVITRRRLGTINNNGITFNDGYRAGTNAVGSVDNTVLIPYQIYGIKTTATVKINAIAMDVSTSADKCMLSDGVTSVEDRLEPHTISQNTKVILTAETDYTTLSDGYFRISANSGNNYVIARINGNNMAVANGTSFGSSGSCSFFVRKGTVIQFSGTAGQSSGLFYPLA